MINNDEKNANMKKIPMVAVTVTKTAKIPATTTTITITTLKEQQ